MPPPQTIKPLYFQTLPHWPTLKILFLKVVRKVFAKGFGLRNIMPDYKKKILNQSQKNFILKKAYSFIHPNSGSCVQNTQTLLQNIFLFTIYQHPEKLTSSHYYELRKTGGHNAPVFVCKTPRPLRVNKKSKFFIPRSCSWFYIVDFVPPIIFIRET